MKRVSVRVAWTIVCISMVLCGGCAVLRPGVKEREAEIIPEPEREFRAVWVATVANIDWPSEPGLPADDQKAEIITILDTAERINLNAVILQVRAQCDAFYKSEYEPWSYFLTGEQGRPPEPYYDPLEYWIEEAHNRGIELHVWFNPYRAHHPMGGEVTSASVVRKRPEIVRELRGGYYWLDPAERETQDYSLAVVMDVVRRYDIDGVHFDDYFYPYPEYNGNDDFPDDQTWKRYAENGGKLSRNDWRRDNVNRFIERLYKAIRKEKPYVKFGISPFGIWRPHYPPSILGFDQFDVLYADAKLWLNEGWIDYFTPQLYWPVNRIAQSYPVLLGWWLRENTRNRNLWPGLYTSRIGNTAGVDDNINQIMITRGSMPDSPGNVHFSMRSFLLNYSGVADSLVSGPYRKPALVPLSLWMDDDPPAAPSAVVSGTGDNVAITWQHDHVSDVFRWIVYYKQGDIWQYDILDRNARKYSLGISGTGSDMDGAGERWWARRSVFVEPITHVAVSAVDRMGNESAKHVLTVP